MTYRVRLECGNCYSRNNYEVDRGVHHNEADLICPNCGCMATAKDYKVMVNNNIGRHIKTEEHVNLDKEKQ